MEAPNSPVINEGDEHASMSVAELHEFVQAHRWTFAKTMPQWPHEYVVRKNVTDDSSFCRFVMTIRRCGNDEPFFARTHRYLDLGAFKYWTMGFTLATTIIINRAPISHAARALALNPTPFVPQCDPAAPIFRAPAR